MRAPIDKNDIAAVEALASADDGVLQEHHRALLTWLQDLNWPVARPVAELLARADTWIVPAVQDVLRGSDSVWKYSLLVGLLPLQSPRVAAALRPDLESLAAAPSDADRAEGVAEAARELLVPTT